MMMDALGIRGLSMGRGGRDLLGPSSSDSDTDADAEDDTEKVGDLAPAEMAGLG